MVDALGDGSFGTGPTADEHRCSNYGQVPSRGGAQVKMVDNRSGFEVLERRECLRLLAGEVVGRVGVVEAGSPLVLPVNYALDGDVIAWTYVLNAYEGGLPSARYLGVLAEAAEAAGAPDDYVAALRNRPCNSL